MADVLPDRVSDLETKVETLEAIVRLVADTARFAAPDAFRSFVDKLKGDQAERTVPARDLLVIEEQLRLLGEF